MSPRVQCSMVDCGASEFRAWHSNLPHMVKFLGQFNPKMTKSEYDRLSEHEKLDKMAVKDFWIGFDMARKAAGYGITME